MAKTVKYIGAQQRWPELPYTGKQSVWLSGQSEERTDIEAAQLLATGQFSDVDAVSQTPAETAAVAALVSRAGIPVVGRGVLLFGNSITADNGTTEGAATPLVRVSSTRGFFNWANRRARADVVANTGISGNTLAQLIARVSTDVDPWMPSCAAIVACCLATNSINAGNSYASVIGELTTLFNTLTSYGKPVLTSTELPRTSFTAAQKEVWKRVNEWLLQSPSTWPLLWVADFASVTADSAGAPLTNMLRDGTHLAPLGAQTTGAALRPILEQLLAVYPVTYPSTLGAYSYTGSGGTFTAGGSGVLPTGFIGARQGGSGAQTGVFSNPTDESGNGTAIKIVMDASAGAAGDAMVAQHSFTVAGGVLPIGKKIWLECDVRISGAARSAYMQLLQGSVQIAAFQPAADTGQPTFDGVTMRLRSSVVTLQTAITGATMSYYLYGASASSGITAEFGRADIYPAN